MSIGKTCHMYIPDALRPAPYIDTYIFIYENTIQSLKFIMAIFINEQIKAMITDTQ